MSVELIYQLSATLLTLGLLFLGFNAYGRFSSYDHDNELTEADNPAVGWVTFGYMAALLIVLTKVLANEADHGGDTLVMVYDLLELFIYGVLAIVLLKIAGIINDRFILSNCENKKEIVDDRNQGAAAAVLGSYVASALMIAGAIHGDARGDEPDAFFSGLQNDILLVLIYFVVGQILMILFAKLYQRVCGLDVLKAIEADYEVDGQKVGGNAAAGTALGLNMIAFGILLLGAGTTESSDTLAMVKDYAIFAAFGLFLLPLWQVFADHVMLQSADLKKEIYEDRNLNAALIEGACVIGLALVLFLVF
ncbi:MAG: DUF350 domain-containing protein [Bradymonadia bacterium]